MRKTKPLLPILLLIIFACKKEHNLNNVASFTNFPLAVGDIWNYQVFDSINNTTQNAVFKITGFYISSGVPVNITHYQTQTIINNVITDSGEIVTAGDTVMYKPTGQGLFSNLTLLLPMSPNSNWHTEYYGDSVFVTGANESVAVLGTTYDSLYNVGRIQSVPDLYIYQNLYIAPHIGIVQETLDIAPWIPVHKTIKLVSYQLH